MTDASLSKSDYAKPRLDKGAFYRLCRQWHGYLSAIAFAALLFFAVTGITLNHPEWFSADGGTEKGQTVTLSKSALQKASTDRDQGKALAQALSKSAQVRGAYSSGEIIDGEAMLRFEGPSGSTDATVNLNTGHADLTIRKASLITMLGDLHRGKNAGQAWRWLIDVAAGLILALSLIGFVLFFSLRFRLRTSLALSATGLAAMMALFAAFVS